MAISQALGVEEIIAQVQLIQNVMHKVMQEGEHFGTIPGCGDKKTLLQPGAQKLTMTFRLAPEYQIQEVDLAKGHKEYRITCTLKTIQGGTFVGQGVGCCSTMESKYRWRGGARVCPKCGKETIIMGRKFKPTDPEPGWLCWAKKGGCGATWPKGATEIESQSMNKIENDNPADCYNTVLKMAKKRAFVDATITATAASDIFTQDVGDDEEPEQPQRQDQAKAAPKANSNTEDQKARFVQVLRDLLPRSEELAKEYGWGSLGNIQWAKVPALTKAYVDWFRAECLKPPVSKEPVPDGRPVTKEDNEELAPAKGDPDWYWDVIITVPRAKTKKVDYMKTPDTIRSLYDAMKGGDDEAKKRLWGLAKEWDPQPWEYQGKTYQPTEADHLARKALDAFCDAQEETNF